MVKGFAVCKHQSIVCKIQIKGLRTEGEGGKRGLLTEEIGEMSYLLEAQAISDFRNIPVGLLQEYFCFLYQPGGDDFGGGLAGIFFQYLVQVVYVYAQGIGIILGRAQLEFLLRRFDGKLSFQQLGKDRRDPCVGIRLLV